MTTSISQQLQAVQTSIAATEENLKVLVEELDAVNAELDTKSGERQQYQLLDDVYSSLNQLSELGAAELFWGDTIDAAQQELQLGRVRDIVGKYREQSETIEQERNRLETDIAAKRGELDLLGDELAELELQEEYAKDDYVIERDARPLPYRPMVMPWSRQGEDERRFRKTLALVFLFVMSLTGLISIWELPEIDNEVVEIPEHLVQLVKKDKPKPRPKPPEKREEKSREQQDEKKQAQDKPKPTPAETKAARKKAESSGVLAFKDNFSDLLADEVDANLGASARLTNSGATAKGDSSRNLVMSQAKSASGGISTASLSRNIGGSAGKKLGGVGFERVESAIGTDLVAEDRPLSDGQGPSRTDEEIQIVFDRYKAALYRIYNRELRKDPTLKGKMVLRITIEPDGAVSLAKVESTDMNSAELSAKVVARVKRFNFGPKDGVPTVTILYPIDFLPAS